MASRDLVSLDDVKSWLNVPAGSTGGDELLGFLISATSNEICAYLGRQSIAPADYAESLDGRGTTRILIKRSPLIDVTAVSINGLAIQSAMQSPNAAGFLFQPWDGEEPGGVGVISLRGFTAHRGVGNIEVAYRAGYQRTEAAVIPAVAPYSYVVESPSGAWSVDVGVSFASSGAALTKVASSPAAGQYSVAAGAYSFAAADAGKAVRVSFGYVPRPLARACMEIVAERFRYRDRIGHRSKSLGGQETVSYDLGNAQSGYSSFVQNILRPYNTVAFVA